MKIVIASQARVGSSRLPGKVLKKINSKSLLQMHLERIAKSKLVTDLIVLTTNEQSADQILNICSELSIPTFQGSLADVLDRFYEGLKALNPHWVVRVTSDCPLIDPVLIDMVISRAIEGGFDYVSNAITPTFPDGLDVECFKWGALEKAWNEASLQSEREHVTPYIWKNSDIKGGSLFKGSVVENIKNQSHLRMTVDEQKDFELIELLVNELGDSASWEEYVSFLESNPETKLINKGIQRNAGYEKSLKGE